jgi:hypothetical protein
LNKYIKCLSYDKPVTQSCNGQMTAQNLACPAKKKEWTGWDLNLRPQHSLYSISKVSQLMEENSTTAQLPPSLFLSI